MYLRQRTSRRHLRLCVASAATAATLFSTPAALAGGFGGTGVDCSNDPAACILTAQGPGSESFDVGGLPAPSRGRGHAASKSGPQGGARTPTGSGVTPPLVCSDTPFVPVSADLVAHGLTQPPGPGHWVLRTCMATLTSTLLPPIPAWIPDGKAALPDPRVLAAQALTKLTLPSPTIESSPGNGVAQTVQLPTWVWLPKTLWTPLSASASVPGESVTAIVVPAQVVWSWGDGTSTVCRGPGTPYVKGLSDAASASPDCGHTYHQASAEQPDQRFTVTATVTWSVTWHGGGQSGTFPNLTTTTTTHWTVRQIQSLIVNM